MQRRQKDLLRSVVGQLRRELVGAVAEDGTARRGDMDRELERLGIAPDGVIAPVDVLPNPTSAELRTRRVAEAELEPVPLRERSAARTEFLERAAYSWINRLLALRAMEARGLIDETLRANPDYEGASEALFVLRQTEPPRTSGPDAGWWAVLEDACRTQAEGVPGLFDPNDPATALRPSTPALLKCVLIVGSAPAGFSLEEADAAFRDADAIGWAYQFYQEAAKTQIYAKLGSGGKAASRSEIAAATQLFTEPYMVKWLLQNSLGRSYHELYPDSSLPDSWEYYIRPESLGKPSVVDLSMLTVMDPCVGSGHFLREAFDMLLTMYRERKPDLRAPEIADRILSRHLHGIDIDPRAAQLAALTLYMRAWELMREEQRRERRSGSGSYRPPAMNIATTPTGIGGGSLQRHLRRHPGDRVMKPMLEAIFTSLEQADVLGSLLRPGEYLDEAIKALQQPHTMQMDFDADEAELRRTITRVANEDPRDLKRLLLERVEASFHAEAGDGDVAASLFGREAEQGVRLLRLLDRKYAVVVTNPPYMGIANMDVPLKRQIERYYQSAKPDLYATFILRCRELTYDNGRVAMVTKEGWMFASGMAGFRAASSSTDSHLASGFLETSGLETVAHLGPRAFTEISGEVVSTVLFVFRPESTDTDNRVIALRVVEEVSPQHKADKLRRDVYARVYEFLQSSVLRIPRAPLAYWLGQGFYVLLASDRTLGRLISVYPGLKTGDDARFLDKVPSSV
jgi:hypothetical protein